MADNEKVVAAETAAPETKKNEKKAAKANKPSVGAKISQFFKNLRSETKKIVWFSKEQTIKSTALVLVSLIVVSAVISVLDLGLNAVIMWLGSLI